VRVPPVSQGCALGWKNGRAFGPQRRWRPVVAELTLDMRPIRIVYDDLRLGESVETVDSLEQVLSRLRAIGQEFSPRVKMPFGIDLVDADGERLSVALGPHAAVISHFSEKDSESVTAVGDRNATGDTLFYFGDHTLMPNKFLIPVDVAWRIIEEWCEHAKLSSVAQWTRAIR
jgi:hypothetical protein